MIKDAADRTAPLSRPPSPSASLGTHSAPPNAAAERRRRTLPASLLRSRGAAGVDDRAVEGLLRGQPDRARPTEGCGVSRRTATVRGRGSGASRAAAAYRRHRSPEEVLVYVCACVLRVRVCVCVCVFVWVTLSRANTTCRIYLAVSTPTSTLVSYISSWCWDSRKALTCSRGQRCVG